MFLFWWNGLKFTVYLFLKDPCVTLPGHIQINLPSLTFTQPVLGKYLHSVNVLLTAVHFRHVNLIEIYWLCVCLCVSHICAPLPSRGATGTNMILYLLQREHNKNNCIFIYIYICTLHTTYIICEKVLSYFDSLFPI